MKWLIWSHEHKAWWAPNGMGYTKERDKAGRFELKEAAQICMDANGPVIPKGYLAPPAESIVPLLSPGTNPFWEPV